MAFNYSPWLRAEMMPNLWCPGCGIGVVVKALIRSMDALGWERNSSALVSGIGCTSRAPGYVDMNTLHTTHGRALTFATGMKLARPESNIVVMSGDGDAAAIGGNHLIHACRRNIDLTLIIVNNQIYGMTGGQYSPASPFQTLAATAPYGNVDHPFDIAKLCIAAGATYVARGHVGNGMYLEKLIKGGMKHKGFAVIEVMSNCHTQYGRRNKHADPIDLIRTIEEMTVTVAAARKMSPEELKDKIVIGVLHKDEEKEEYVSQYRILQRYAQERVRIASKRIAEQAAVKEKKDETLGASPGPY